MTQAKKQLDGPRSTEEAYDLPWLEIPLKEDIEEGITYIVEAFRQFKPPDRTIHRGNETFNFLSAIHSICKVDGQWYKLDGSLNDFVTQYIMLGSSKQITFPRKITFTGEIASIRYEVTDDEAL